MCLLKFKALADETRLRLVSILSSYELSVNELVQILDMGQSRVSRHLKILAEAGLLRARRDGLWVFYTAPANGANADFLKAILPFLPDSAQRQADLTHAGLMLEERARRAQQFFNAMAEKWDDLNSEILGQFDLPARVASALPACCHVAADLGCGTGAVLARICEKAELAIGVDGSSAMLELCRSRLSCPISGAPGLSLRIGELSHLPLANQEADFACLNLVLHHLPDPASAFSEIRRILAPGGTLFITDFLKHNDEAMRSRYGDHWLGFEQEELASFLTACNFRISNTEFRPVGRKLKLIMLTARLD